MYYVNVEGLYGDCRIFTHCNTDNKQNALDYANQKKEQLNQLRMKNAITVTENSFDGKNIILKL